MPIGLLLAKVGIFNHNFSTKFDEYLVSGTYAGELIDWKQYLPRMMVDLTLKVGGEKGFALL